MVTCPHCHGSFQRIEIVDIPLTRLRQQEYRGVAYTCPHCHVVLSVAANPFQIRDEIAQDVLEKLKSWATGPR
jgi:transposase